MVKNQNESVVSITIDFADSEHLERILGPNTENTPDFEENIIINLSCFICESHGSTNDAEIYLRQQCLIARSIIAFAQATNRCTMHLYSHEEKLNFLFSFRDEETASIFRTNLREFVWIITGVQIQ